MDILKIFTLFVMMTTGISVSQATTSVVRNDSLSAHGFDFTNENTLKAAKDIYGACYRLEEPLFIDLSAEGHGVAGKLSWVSKVRFTLAQSKVISPQRLRAKNTTDGVTWINDGLYSFGNRKTWSTLLPSNSTDPHTLTFQDGWEVSTKGVNNNTVYTRVNIPTRRLQTLEFIFTSQANDNDVHIMFERKPGTNYMKNTGIWRPNNGDVVPELDADPANKIGVGDFLTSSAPYAGFNLVRTERIRFHGRQYNASPSVITMGAYEVDFTVEPDTAKYGFTAEQFDAACK